MFQMIIVCIESYVAAGTLDILKIKLSLAKERVYSILGL